MSVKIIVDSTADIPMEQLKLLDIRCIPMRILFGEEEYLDGITISHEEFYEKLTTSEVLPTTSQVPPFDFEEVFREVKEAGDTAVCLTVSSKLSGTYQSACIAASDYEDCIRVVDSSSVCVGLQILAFYAAMLRDEGKSADEIADILEEAKKKVRVVALLDTLEYLKKGGRISSTAAFAGTLLSIKPVIGIVNGEVAILGKARGSKNGANILRSQCTLNGGIDFSMPLSLAYSGNSDNALKKYIEDSRDLYEGHTDRLPIYTIGSAIGVHAGPGAIAFAFFSKE